MCVVPQKKDERKTASYIKFSREKPAQLFAYLNLRIRKTTLYVNTINKTYIYLISKDLD